MRIVIINHSDTQGGAAIVALRLAHALCDLGVDTRMLVIDRRSDDPLVGRMGNTWRNRWNFGMERLGIYLCNGRSRDTLFKIDTCSHGVDVSDHEWVREADVVMLNWVNQGTLSLRNIEQLHKAGKQIVWTMHDMWNCTGVCHYAHDCELYREVCYNCPLLPGEGEDLSTTTQDRKAHLYERVPIKFVAVSNWLAHCCRDSSLMRHSHVSVIHNAVPVGEFEWTRLRNDYHGVPAERTVIALGSRRLDVAVKGFDQLIAVTRHIAEHRPELAARIHLLLYGDLHDRSLLQQIAVPVTHIGSVSGTRAINEVYRHADIVLSTALYENLPTTLIEGQASGAVPVTFGRGGQADIVDHCRNGYIARYCDAADVARGIEWAMEAAIDRRSLHDEVERRFSAPTIARKYLELIGQDITS